MYYPILRGRQNELLAVRELAEDGKLRHIVPIIEPVKASSSLISAVMRVKACGGQVGIIQDPVVGSFRNDLRFDPSYGERFEEAQSGMIRVFRDCEKAVGDCSDGEKALFLEPEDKDEAYRKACDVAQIRFTLVHADSTRQKRRVRGDAVGVADSFRPQDRNADYRGNPDDLLTEEHLYYSEEGYAGFSDYSVIGSRYSDSGFMPRAVALHLAYFDGGGVCRLRHFVSSEGFSQNDIAGKYNDALRCMVNWADGNRVLATAALEECREILRSERFPGLGYAKKLAVKHHLELMDSFLETA